jgi:pilus assembly protein Flp/PilA
MLKFVKSFVRDESGASAAEYALILAVVGAAIGTAALLLAAEIRDAVVGAEANVSASQGALPGPDA